MTPPFLKTGDTIGIVATARWISEDVLQPAIDLFASWGLRVKVASNVHSRHFQLAGEDDLRRQSLQEMLDSPDVQAIIVARGGYGTVRLVDQLNLEGLQRFPKWICGFSDVTVLHNALNNLGIATIHGPMPFTFGEATPASIESLKDCLFGNREEIRFHSSSLVHELSDVTIVGGNLSVIASQLGSSTQPETKGKLLFLEDIDEMIYHIDRMLMALKRAGVFEDCKGILAGGFTGMRDNTKAFGFGGDNPWAQSPEEILRDLAIQLNLPLIQSFPAGHMEDNRAFYLGRTCSFQSSQGDVVLKYQ